MQKRTHGGKHGTVAIRCMAIRSTADYASIAADQRMRRQGSSYIDNSAGDIGLGAGARAARIDCHRRG